MALPDRRAFKMACDTDSQIKPKVNEDGREMVC